MRGAVFVLLCRCVLAQQPGIEGVAIDAVTRRPVAGVHITMAPAMDDGAAPGDAYGAISRPDGHFSIAGMKPDSYFLRAARNGYVYMNTSSVTLKAGEPLKDFTVGMTPEAVIAGRVLDEFGDPVQHAQVDAAGVSAHLGGNARTDERGQFRLALPPGKFYVKASLERMMWIRGAPEIRADGRPVTAYAATYYPGTANKSQATLVEAGPGLVVTGLDIPLAQERSLAIRGEVTGRSDAVAGAFVVLYGDAGFANAVNTTPDGKFTITGLTPGIYKLRATLATPEGLLRSRRTDVRLDNADASVTLALVAGEALSGMLEMEGDKNLTVRLEPEAGESVEESKGGQAGEDGAFRLEQIFPGKFRVRVLPMPENGFVKSVTVDGAEVAGDAIDLSQGVGGAKIKVAVSRNGGQVEGAVLGGDGEPLKSPFAFVMMAASVSEARLGNFKPVAAGAKFRYAGLRPGKYRLIAVDGRAFDGLEDEAAGALFAKAPEIEVRELDRIEKSVTVIDVAP